MKQLKFTLCVFLISCVITFSATAATGQNESLSVNTGIILALAICLGLGIKAISKKLKQVDQDLQDAFGEKVL